MGSFYKQQLNDWKRTLDVKADVVLDIGGAQDPIKGKTKSWDVKDYKIIDLEVPHVLTQEPDITHDMNNEFSEIPHLRPKHWKNYIPEADLIFMLGVMDYVIEPGIAMRNIYDLLKDNGTAWIEFPFVYPIHQPIDDEGCRYSEGCIRRLANQAELKIEEVIYKRPKPDNPFLLQFYSADGMRAAKGVDHNVTGYIVRFSK